MRIGKGHRAEEIELRNQEETRVFREKETYKCLGILEANIIKQIEMKEKKIKLSF